MSEHSWWGLLLTIIEAGLAGETAKARAYTELLEQHIRNDGDAALADRLQRILTGESQRNTFHLTKAPDSWVDSPGASPVKLEGQHMTTTVLEGNRNRFARLEEALERLQYLERGNRPESDLRAEVYHSLLPAVRALCEELGIERGDLLAALG